MSRLLLLSSLKWEDLWQRHHAIARAAAEDGWNVDFVQARPRNLYQVATYPYRRSRTRGRETHRQLRVDGVNVCEMSRIRSLRPFYDLAVVYLPDRLSELMVKMLKPRRIVYDAVLDWETVPRDWYPPLGWRRSEQRLSQLANCVVTTDSEGMKSLLATRAIPSTVVYPAADSEFLGLACSRDYWTRRDGVLYFGTIRDEIDVELLARLSDAGVQVTVVGPSAIESTAEYLRSHSVSVWPGVAIDELPELVSQFKVTILPYRGDRIGTLLPAKYWNCLVSGAWVVASTLGLYGLTEGNVRRFADSRGITADFINNLFESAPPRPVTIPDWTTRWQEFKEAAMVEAN